MGTSSFSYRRGDPYPYTYATLPAMLDGAGFETAVDLGPGVSCFRFSREGRPVYLLWSDRGKQTANLHELSGQVRVTDAAGGESAQDASSLHLTAEPLFVEPAR